MPDLPRGTVTFLFTDIEGSTRHWEEHREAMQAAMARHDALLRAAIESRAGIGLKELGSHRFRDLASPEQVCQLTHPELPADGLASRTKYVP